ncbi:MAG: hypothetical protein [Siphoviridae sp. cttb18]|nr:MAG: hypothetical protein [Siphoviridae sp. cttb18]
MTMIKNLQFTHDIGLNKIILMEFLPWAGRLYLHYRENGKEEEISTEAVEGQKEYELPESFLKKTIEIWKVELK